MIEKAHQHGKQLSRDSIVDVVTHNDKQRFSLSEDGLKIRANQGHSLTVDLTLVARQPPDVLYHSTATRFLDAILAEGLKPQARQHVHLSHDNAMAINIGQRHGKPVVLEVAAAIMQNDGYMFFYLIIRSG